MQSSYSAVHVPYLTRLDSHQRSWSTFHHEYELPFTVAMVCIIPHNKRQLGGHQCKGPPCHQQACTIAPYLLVGDGHEVTEQAVVGLQVVLQLLNSLSCRQVVSNPRQIMLLLTLPNLQRIEGNWCTLCLLCWQVGQASHDCGTTQNLNRQEEKKDSHVPACLQSLPDLTSVPQDACLLREVEVSHGHELLLLLGGQL